MYATLFRPLLSGLCMLAATGAMAQTVPAAIDRAPGDRPMLIDDTARTPSTVPEIIRAPDDFLGSPSSVDPRSVMMPPSLDHQIFAWGRTPPP